MEREIDEANKELERLVEKEIPSYKDQLDAEIKERGVGVKCLSLTRIDTKEKERQDMLQKIKNLNDERAEMEKQVVKNENTYRKEQENLEKLKNEVEKLAKIVAAEQNEINLTKELIVEKIFVIEAYIMYRPKKLLQF